MDRVGLGLLHDRRFGLRLKGWDVSRAKPGLALPQLLCYRTRHETVIIGIVVLLCLLQLFKQVVKVSPHTAASPPHTGSSIVFARWANVHPIHDNDMLR